MGTLKLKSYESAKELRTSTREEVKVAKEEFKSFRKENGLGKDETGEKLEGKVKKTFDKLKASVEAKEAIIAEIDEYMAANKPAKEPKVRQTIYEYPADATSADKKKIRAAARAAAKREEKEKNGGGKKKAEKTEKAEKLAAEAKSSKKDKKADKGEKKEKKAKEAEED